MVNPIEILIITLTYEHNLIFLDIGEKYKYVSLKSMNVKNVAI